jgi:hypothetical protein
MGGQCGGAPPNEKAATRRRGSGRSRKPSATGESYTETTTTARQPQPGEITCYSGLECTGWLTPRNGRFLAFRADGSFIGAFANSKLAASSIYGAMRPRGQA